MFSIGFFELFIISIIALVILGPERLPLFIRWVEETIKSIRASFNKTSKEIKDSIYVEDHNKKND
jgi:sec-independent protein translocase protein TatB